MNVETFALVTNKAARNGSESILRDARDYMEKQVLNAKDITIVSAFYGEDFTKAILYTAKSIGTKRKVTLVFASVSEVAREEQIKSLRSMKEDIVQTGRCSAKDVDIRLADTTRFLHAKLFRFRLKGKSPVYILGSANLTNAAFNQNDEVMVAIRGRHPGLNGYIQHVLCNSHSIEELPDQSVTHSWREFLRNAYLYYRPNRSITYSIDPFAEDGFTEIAKRLRERIIQPLPFADQNVLSLNLVELLELKVPENSRLGFRLPTYSIQTDYGYWVPKEYVDFIEEKLAKSSKPKRRALEKRGKELQDADESYVRGRIKIYLDEVEKRLGSGSKSLMLSKVQKEAIYERIIRRVGHLTKMLAHPKTLERLAKALIGVPVPEFWEDQVSVDRFFEGFCNDIVDKLNAPSNIPTIVTHLKQEFQLTDEASYDSEACQKKIKSFFDNGKSWASSHWPPVSPGEQIDAGAAIL